MPTLPERWKASEGRILALVIALNLLILAGIAFHMYERTRSLREAGEGREMLKWGERAPELGVATAVSGERVPLGADQQHLTLLFFFDSTIASEVAGVTSTLNGSPFSADVRIIGIFRGTRDEWTAASPRTESRLVVVPDAAGDLHRHFRVPTSPAQAATLAISREGEIRLSVNSIVTPELLSDFLDRQLGREAAHRESPS